MQTLQFYLIPNSISAEDMKEEFSDSCMHQLMGSNSNNYHKCDVSNDCLQAMLQRGHLEYTLTHQLLYIMLAEEVIVVCFITIYNSL